MYEKTVTSGLRAALSGCVCLLFVVSVVFAGPQTPCGQSVATAADVECLDRNSFNDWHSMSIGAQSAARESLLNVMSGFVENTGESERLIQMACDAAQNEPVICQTARTPFR